MFLDRLAVSFANTINATQGAFRYERRTGEITIVCPCVKPKNKVIEQNYVVFIDSHKKVRRRGKTKCVGSAAEICLKTFVEMFEALHSGMTGSEK